MMLFMDLVVNTFYLKEINFISNSVHLSRIFLGLQDKSKFVELIIY